MAFHLHEISGLKLYQFQSLSRLPGVVHAVTTRAGGVSRPPFDSLNLGGEEDDPAALAANRKRLARALGLKRLVWARQVHGTRIVALENGAAPGEADGLATNEPGVGLLIKTADCQALVLAAPAKGVVANLHVGWRGNAAGMPGAGVAFLKKRYGVAPGELHAAIAPGLGACCAQFVNHRNELPEWFYQFRVQGTDRFDLEASTVAQLVAAGVGPERIETSGRCTMCSHEFFSYRRDKVTGRFGTVVALAKEGN